MYGSESGSKSGIEVHSSWWYPSVQKHRVKILYMFRESRVVHSGQCGQYEMGDRICEKDFQFPPLKFGNYISI